MLADVQARESSVTSGVVHPRGADGEHVSGLGRAEQRLGQVDLRAIDAESRLLPVAASRVCRHTSNVAPLADVPPAVRGGI